ncbi:MAG: antitoxin Xre/MbcA/ParS toxin-binding domain-containing protein [Chitinophagaceae bacterium]
MPVATSNISIKLDKEITSIVRKSNIDKKFIGNAKIVSWSDFLSDKMLMRKVIHEGIPYSFFQLMLHYTPFTEKDWADLLDISSKSLQRYKQSAQKFKPGQSEKIMEIAEVTNMGLEVFEDMEKFKLWLDTPNFALGNLKPIELLKDSYGKEMVMSELTRINYGILS